MTWTVTPSRIASPLVAVLLLAAMPCGAGTPPPAMTPFHGAAASAGADAQDGDRRGDAVALSGDVLLVGAPLDNLSRGDRAGSVLVYRRGPQGWALEAKLVPPQPQLGGGFGSAVALEGSTAVIGASSGFGTVSAAFVFAHDGTRWRLQATLQPLAPPEATVRRFGAAVAISGSRVLVGAPGTTYGSTKPFGAAFVFAGAGEAWNQQAMFRLPQDAPDDAELFGSAVALSGADAVIGARSPSGVGRGEAFAFHDDGGGAWGSAQRLSPAAALPPNAGFGTSVALAGGLALVSAPSAPAQFVFRRVAGTWQQRSSIAALGNVTAFAPPLAYFGGPGGVVAFAIEPDGTNSTALGPIAPPPRAFEFGAAVAADGQRVVIGAPLAAPDTGIAQPGAASVHLAEGQSFTLEQDLVQTTGPIEEFGRAVAIDGDNALVAAPGAGTSPTTAQGIVRWLERRDGRWRVAGELRAPSGDPLRFFGSSLALRGARALVGGTSINGGSAAINREAWLFRRDEAGWTMDAFFEAPDEFGQGDAFTSIALADSLTVIGAPQTSTIGAGRQGAVYAFAETPGGWVGLPMLRPPSNTPGQLFGARLALDEQVLLVAAPSQGFADPGAVHVYRRSGSGWVGVQTLVGEAPASRFGSELLLDSENAWVVALSGATRLFRFPRAGDGTFGQPQRFPAPTGAQGFGSAIGGGGDRVLVGAVFEGFEPSSPTTPGAAYRIERTAGAWEISGRIAAGDYSPLAQHFGFAIAADAGAFIVGAPRSGSELPFGNPFEGAAFVVDDQTLFADGFEP